MRTIIAGTTDGLRAVGAGGHTLLAGRSVTAIARRGPELWAITGDGGVWRATEGGAPERLAAVDGADSLMLPAKIDALVGILGAHLLAVGGSTVERIESFDAVSGRDRWYTPWGGPPSVRSMAEGADGTLYANVHVGGIVRSTDAGVTWYPTPLDIDTDVHQVIGHPSEPGFVLAAAGEGFATSRDGGETWSFDNDGLDEIYCRALAIAGDAVLVTASASHLGQRAALWRRPLDGRAPFERCSRGLPERLPDNIDTHCLASAGNAVAFGTSDGCVYASEDAGASWTTVATGLLRVTGLLFA